MFVSVSTKKWPHEACALILIGFCHPDTPPPFDARTRFRLRLWLLLLAPLSLAATALETLLRSGATVHVVAERRDA